MLRAQGTRDDALNLRAVIISEVCYAYSAWWGFTSAPAAGRQHLEAFLRRSVCSCLCPPDNAYRYLRKLLTEAIDDPQLERTLFQMTVMFCITFCHQNLTVIRPMNCAIDIIKSYSENHLFFDNNFIVRLFDTDYLV